MRSDNDSVSIIVPAYNAAGTIEATIASVRAQTHANWEMLVVDDGSSDDTAERVRNIALQDHRIRLVRQERRGPSAARNHGLAMAGGEYIAPIDADDLWHPRYLEAQLRTFRSEGAPPYSFVYSLHRQISPTNMVVSQLPCWGVCGRAYLRHVLLNFVGCGSAIVAPRIAVLDAGMYDVRAFEAGGAEDYRLQLRLASVGPVGFTRMALVGYRRGLDSYSADPGRAMRSRLAALASEQGALAEPASLAKWVTADAGRVAALQSLRSDWRRAIPLLASSIAEDPEGAAGDIWERITNRARPRTPPYGAQFFDVSPEADLSHPRNEVLVQRLEWLKAYESDPGTPRTTG